MSVKKTVVLDEFVGKTFALTACSTAEVANQSYFGEENASTITFTLDGVTYQAMENPSDGYRSSLKEIFIVQQPPANQFPACYVRVEKGGERDDTIVFKSVATNLPVLEVGTRNHDDHYPCFVGSFTPENMDANQAELIAAREQAQKDDDRLRQKLNEQARLREVEEAQAQAARDAAGWGCW